MPGHNKFDYSYSGRTPSRLRGQCLLLPVTEESLLAVSTGDAAYVGALLHPSFQALLPNP